MREKIKCEHLGDLLTEPLFQSYHECSDFHFFHKNHSLSQMGLMRFVIYFHETMEQIWFDIVIMDIFYTFFYSKYCFHWPPKSCKCQNPGVIIQACLLFIAMTTKYKISCQSSKVLINFENIRR